MNTNIEYFKLPIEYISDKIELSNSIVDDLELVKTKESDVTSIYDITFNPTTIFSKATTHLWSKYYTDNVKYLKDSQQLIKNFKPISQEGEENYERRREKLFETVHDIHKEVTTDTGFYEKYQYISNSWFKHFNNNAKLLQILSIYDLSSPAISLTLPIIFLIIPFFILKLSKINIDMTTYIKVLKEVISKHPLGNAFNNFSNVTTDKRFYISLSIGFYFFQLYQNFMSCRRYYINLKKMHDHINSVKEYLNYTILEFENFENQASLLKHNQYSDFIKEMNKQRDVLVGYKRELKSIDHWKFNIKKIINIGHVMKCFYALHDNSELKQAVTWSFGFNGYIDNIYKLNLKLKEKTISTCKFSNKTTSFKSAYYPAVMDNPIKNSYNLNKQLLITGPNAAGKTTFIKTTFYNILFSQQCGLGFYSKAKIFPFKHLHCYLNIPDTSGRDSLFQAEARRCKNILDSIKNYSKDRHFCIFDELYSGTNPYEATSSSISFLKYLNKYTNFSYILTTHYLEVCKQFTKTNCVKNCYMNIIKERDDFKYTYKLKTGISEIKGGVKVLSELNYPVEIIEHAKKLIA